MVPTVSLTYISGAHAFKVGFQDRFGPVEQTRVINGDIGQQYRNGVPFAVVVLNTPISTHDQSEPRHGHLRPGHLDDQAPDVEPGPALGPLQFVDSGANQAGRPVRRRAALRGDSRPAELAQRGAAVRRRLRSVRRRPDRRSRATGASTCPARARLRPELQSDVHGDRYPDLDRLEP